MSKHLNGIKKEEAMAAAEMAACTELCITNVDKLNLTDDAKFNTGSLCSDDETGSTVTIGEIGVDDYFDETYCDDSVIDTTDYREAAAAANLLPVLINITGKDGAKGSGDAKDSGAAQASGDAEDSGAAQASGDAEDAGAAQASGDAEDAGAAQASDDAEDCDVPQNFVEVAAAVVKKYQGQLKKIIRSEHSLLADPADNQAIAGTSGGRRPRREAAIAASQALVRFSSKRKRPGDSRSERTLLLPGYIDANKSIRKSCTDYGLMLPELAYDAINLDEHLIRNCYMSILPAKSTIDEFLDHYVKEKSANVDMFNFLRVAFNEVLPIWCLRRIETLQHADIVKKYPGRRLSSIYGLIHFLRFSMYLPRLFSRLEFQIVDDRATRIHPVVEFLNGFFEYMVEHGLHIDVDKDYSIMLPDYYNMAYDVLHKTYPTEPSVVLE